MKNLVGLAKNDERKEGISVQYKDKSSEAALEISFYWLFICDRVLKANLSINRLSQRTSWPLINIFVNSLSSQKLRVGPSCAFNTFCNRCQGGAENNSEN